MIPSTSYLHYLLHVCGVSMFICILSGSELGSSCYYFFYTLWILGWYYGFAWHSYFSCSYYHDLWLLDHFINPCFSLYFFLTWYVTEEYYTSEMSLPLLFQLVIVGVFTKGSLSESFSMSCSMIVSDMSFLCFTKLWSCTFCTSGILTLLLKKKKNICTIHFPLYFSAWMGWWRAELFFWRFHFRTIWESFMLPLSISNTY